MLGACRIQSSKWVGVLILAAMIVGCRAGGPPPSERSEELTQEQKDLIDTTARQIGERAVELEQDAANVGKASQLQQQLERRSSSSPPICSTLAGSTSGTCRSGMPLRMPLSTRQQPCG